MTVNHWGNPLPTQISNKNKVFALSTMLFMYTLENAPFQRYINGPVYLYIIRPILWISIGVIINNLRCFRPGGKVRHRKLIVEWSIIFGIIYVSINLFAGFMYGLGKSPYSRSLGGIIANIFYLSSWIYGKEIVRNYLINSGKKKESYIVFILIAALMTLINFNINRYRNLKDIEGIVKFLAGYLVPSFSNNLLASYLSYLGGPIPSIFYLGIIELFHWVSPILPNLKWIVSALIGILVPIFFLMGIQSIYLNSTKQIKKREKEGESLFSWIVTCIASIGIIWFVVGVFPIYPSVVATGSMEPVIMAGDMVLISRITDMDGIYNLKEGEIIQFSKGHILVSHRIIEIVEDKREGIKFKTKGDNNSTPDLELVGPQDIRGLMVYKIPKIGWPTLLIKSKSDILLEEVVY